MARPTMKRQRELREAFLNQLLERGIETMRRALKPRRAKTSAMDEAAPDQYYGKRDRLLFAVRVISAGSSSTSLI